jgi:hypothetical protein
MTGRARRASYVSPMVVRSTVRPPASSAPAPPGSCATPSPTGARPVSARASGYRPSGHPVIRRGAARAGSSVSPTAAAGIAPDPAATTTAAAPRPVSTSSPTVEPVGSRIRRPVARRSTPIRARRVRSTAQGPLFGAPCRFAPGLPACATGLACVDTLVLDGVLVEPGYCTSGCDATHCCPGGWGCTADVGGRGRCRSEAFDDPGLECSGVPAGGDGPAPEPPAAPTAPAGGEAAAAREDDGFHCAAGLTPFLYALLGLGGLRRRRRG